MERGLTSDTIELSLSASEWSFLTEDGDPAGLYRGMKACGYNAIEMPTRANREAARAAGLEVLNIAGPGMQGGTQLNRDSDHAELVPKLRGCLEDAAVARIPQVIFFSGNRAGIADDAGRDACIRGAKALAPDAERLGVTLTLEVLNRFDHPDYQADSTAFALDVVRGVSSPNVKLLYDIYHMDRMGEPVLDDIVKHLPYIEHLHVAGSPERDQPSSDQRIDYAALVRRALDAGYTGHWGMEFLPANDPLIALDQAGRLFQSYARMPSSSML